MLKTRKKPTQPTPPARPDAPRVPATMGARANPRLQSDQRWQRTKRYGWSGR